MSAHPPVQNCPQRRALDLSQDREPEGVLAIEPLSSSPRRRDHPLQLAGAPEGFIAFTGSPAVLAGASLDRIEATASGAKLTRAEVGALMERMFENLTAGRPLL